MTQVELIAEFINGLEEGKCGGSGNLYIKDNRLIHFFTVLAERDVDGFIVNTTWYSIITSRVQKNIISLLGENKYIEIKGIPEGYRNSLKDYNKAR